MLSIEQRRKTQLYSYRGGMLNIAWIVGIARRLTPTGGFIQQTNNLNHMIPFVLADGMIMPSGVKDKSPIKIRARMHGGSSEQGEPIIVLKAFDFEEPNVFDMPSRDSWKLEIRPGTPVDAEEPEMLGSSEPENVPEERIHMTRMPSSANIAEVAGFIAGMKLEAPKTKADGDVNKGCLIIGIRQTPDQDDMIPVRVYGPQVTALRRKLRIGQDIKVRGQLRVRNKNTGEAADAAGVLPTHKWLYLHAPLNDFRLARMGVDIKETPAWVIEMRESYEQRRTERMAASQAAAASQAPATPAEQAPAKVRSAPATSSPSQPAPQPQAATNPVALDPSIFAAFDSNKP